MSQQEISNVLVRVRAPQIEFVMTGWDENGGQFETIVLGCRVFEKVMPPPSSADDSPITLEINAHRYSVAGAPEWQDDDGCVSLSVNLSCADNQALQDCLADTTWREVQTSGSLAGAS
ncbi:MAG: hypothetical protein AB7I50_02005 [Vicinamibacterales bacterium]